MDEAARGYVPHAYGLVERTADNELHVRAKYAIRNLMSMAIDHSNYLSG
jgi:hypothetical protein